MVGVNVQQQGTIVSIENNLLRIEYDLATGMYGTTDKRAGRAIVANAATRAGEFSSTAPGTTRTFAIEPLADALGIGRSLLISSVVPNGPKLLLRISLYPECGFIAISAGLENTTANTIQLKEFSPLDGGMAFKSFDTAIRYSTLDGHGGGVPTFVAHDAKKRTSRNNLLVTFGNPGDNRSLVMGGLTYTEFEKYAEATRNADGSLAIRLSANDPVGKRIGAGTRYLPDDRFYVDFLTANPFDALESYANRLRLAQGIVLPVCRFPIVDTWFATLQEIKTNPGPSLAILAKRAGVSEADYKVYDAGTTIYSLPQNRQAFRPGTSMTALPYAAQQISGFLKAIGMAKTPPRLEGLFQPQFVDAAP